MAAKLTIDDLQEAARKKGGECLSNVYVNKGTRYRWKCAEGHEWEAIANSIKQGSWCRICLGDRLRGNIKELHHVAEGRGGKCLSDEFKRQRCAENKVLLFEVRAVISPTPEKVRKALAAAVQELAIPLEINPEYRQMLEEHGLACSPTQDAQKAA